MPLLHSATLSELSEADLWLKAENLQTTGSFKPRGGINATLQLAPEERSRSVISISAGNHAATLTFAARMSGTHATLVMPETAALSKIAATRGYGAEVIVVGRGGLVSGIAVALKALKPGIVVIGVEPEGSLVTSQSLAAGRTIRLEHFASIADSLNAPFSAPTSFALVQGFMDEMVIVSDEEITRALALILERTTFLVEPAGAAAVAALVVGRVPEAIGKTTVAVLSGGNVDLACLGQLVAPAATVAR